jgi:hypothetical protein
VRGFNLSWGTSVAGRSQQLRLRRSRYFFVMTDRPPIIEIFDSMPAAVS